MFDPETDLYNTDDCVDVVLYLVNAGYGGDKEKATLLLEACRCDKLDALKQVVEKHQVHLNSESH